MRHVHRLLLSFVVRPHGAVHANVAPASLLLGRAAPPRGMSSAAAAPAPAAPALAPAPIEYVQLDRAAFSRQLHLTALRVPARHAEPLTKALGAKLLRLPFQSRIRPVVLDPEGDAGSRLVLLAEGASPLDLSGLSEEQRAAVAAAGGVALAHTVTLGYDNMTVDEVLRAVIPSGLAGLHDLPTSFETVGPVAHVNLRPEYARWKYLIAQVILDKNRALRCVVNKTGVINEVFRTFPMEVLAGPDDTRVELRHVGATFRFDFRRVYWNSRLSHEHEHMITRVIPRGSTVADMFCGVGPFAVPLALPGRGCTVHANDLNPRSHEALTANAAANKVPPGRLVAYNLDGRAFIRRLVRPWEAAAEQAAAAAAAAASASSDSGSSAAASSSSSTSSAAATGAAAAAVEPAPAASPIPPAPVPFTHVLMNLPADAIAFLDVFHGLYRGLRLQGDGSDSSGAGEAPAAAVDGVPPGLAPLPLPRIHVYCFVKAPESFEAAKGVAGARILRALAPEAVPAGLDDRPPADRLAAALTVLPDLSFRHVRDVSPRKMMLCASFTLPAAVAVAQPLPQAAAGAATGDSDGDSDDDDDGGGGASTTAAGSDDAPPAAKRAKTE